MKIKYNYIKIALKNESTPCFYAKVEKDAKNGSPDIRFENPTTSEYYERLSDALKEATTYSDYWAHLLSAIEADDMFIEKLADADDGETIIIQPLPDCPKEILRDLEDVTREYCVDSEQFHQLFKNLPYCFTPNEWPKEAEQYDKLTEKNLFFNEFCINSLKNKYWRIRATVWPTTLEIALCGENARSSDLLDDDIFRGNGTPASIEDAENLLASIGTIEREREND